MKKSMYLTDFREEFLSSDTYKNNFSYEGLEHLYNHLTELEEGKELEMDVIAFCCEFGEDTVEGFAEYYEIDKEEIENHEAVISVYDDKVLYHAW